MEWSNGEYFISDDRERIDLDRVAEGLKTTYWAKERSDDLIQRAWNNSTFCFGLYFKTGLVGFARVTSDRSIIAYLSDVFIFPEHRGKGLGEWMCRTIIEHPALRDLRWYLNTRDMHRLYKKLGFVDGDPTAMVRRIPVTEKLETPASIPQSSTPKALIPEAPIPPARSLDDASYDSALDELMKLEFFGMKLGLENITKLVEFLGRPERNYKTIHVAGTNGKGSVASMLAAVFQADGKKVGLYTSPHLVDFRERIKINGEMIPRESLREILKKIWPLVLELKATFFEVTTAVAFEYFSLEKVDIAIIETGLGGRMDATNVIEHPIATVITSIGWDHMEQLGDSLELIASEKAGIFKNRTPAIVRAPRELRGKFEQIAQSASAPIRWLEPDGAAVEGIDVLLPGAHQNENVRTVLATLEALNEKPAAEKIKYGIEHVAELTGFRSRLERYHSKEFDERGVDLLLDVGHNLNAIEALTKYFIDQDVRPIVVAGFMKDKAVDGMLRELSRIAKYFIAVEAPSKRALGSNELFKKAHSAGMMSLLGGDVVAGVQLALDRAEKGETVLIVGSHYVVGEFLANESRIVTVEQPSMSPSDLP